MGLGDPRRLAVCRGYRHPAIRRADVPGGDRAGVCGGQRQDHPWQQAGAGRADCVPIGADGCDGRVPLQHGDLPDLDGHLWGGGVVHARPAHDHALLPRRRRGVFGNTYGGWRGAALGGVINGLFLAIGQATAWGLLSHTAPELATLGDPDWYIIIWVLRAVLSPFKS